jgi:hypothetical protein
MSLSTRDQRVLDAIRGGLTVSDPRLAGLLGMFTRLAQGDEMPAHERIRARPRRVPQGNRRPSRRGSARSVTRGGLRRLGPGGVVMLVCLLISVALVSVAVVLGVTSPSVPCRKPWALGCFAPAPAASTHGGLLRSSPGHRYGPAGGAQAIPSPAR